MPRVYKYDLPSTFNEPFELRLPDTAILLHVAEQRGALRLWARVNPDGPQRAWRFVWVPTGGDVPAFAAPVGTVLLMGGALVYHLFLLDEERQ